MHYLSNRVKQDTQLLRLCVFNCMQHFIFSFEIHFVTELHRLSPPLPPSTPRLRQSLDLRGSGELLSIIFFIFTKQQRASKLCRNKQHFGLTIESSCLYKKGAEERTGM